MKHIFILIFLFFSICVFSQNLPKFSDYQQVKNILNPAAIFEQNPTAKVFYRNQWLGLDGAPVSYGFDFTYKTGKSSFGGYLLSDKAGIFNQNILQVNYAYSLQISRETYLNFGLTGGFNLYKLNYQDLILYHPDDPYIANVQSTAFLPDINFGTVYTNIRNASDYAFASLARRYPIYYVGFSVQHLLGVISKSQAVKDNSYMNRHINLMGAIMHPLGSFGQIQELMLVKYTPNAPVQVDLGAKIYYNESYWIGLSYRTSNDIIANAGIQFKYFLLSYSFDFSVFKLPNKTSHEVVLGFILFDKNSISKY